MGIYNQTNATHLLHHAHVRGALADEFLRKKLSQVDTRDLYEYLRTGKSSLSDPATLRAQNRPVLLGGWELDVPATQQQFEAKYDKMDDREKKKVREYLEALAPTLMLSFSETFFYLDGRYFSNRSLGVKPPSHRAIGAGLPENGLLPRVPASPGTLAQLSIRTLQAGPWQANNDFFTAQFRWPHAQPPVSCEVEFQEFSNRLRVTLKDFNQEAYIFLRTGSVE